MIEWLSAPGLEPWPHQKDAQFSLSTGSKVILGTPTGSGKSLFARDMMFMDIASGQRAFTSTTTKALVSEKIFY